MQGWFVQPNDSLSLTCSGHGGKCIHLIVVLTNFILFSKDKIVFQNSSGPISLSLTLNGFVMLLPMLLLILLVVLMIFFYGSDLASKCFFGILPVFHVGLLEHRRGAGVVAGVVNGSMPRF